MLPATLWVGLIIIFPKCPFILIFCLQCLDRVTIRVKSIKADFQGLFVTFLKNSLEKEGRETYLNKWSKAGGIRTLRYVIKALEGFKVPRVLLCIDSNFHLVIQNDIFSFKFQPKEISLRVELTHTHCSKSSFFVQKFNFDNHRFFGVKNSWKCCGFGLF